jgi:cytochrome P450
MNSSTSLSISGKPLPPIVPGLPILGSALDIMNDPLPFMVEAYQRWGPIYRFRILNREFTVLAGPEANQFLSKQENLLSNKIYAGISEEMKTDYFILAEDGPRHRALRKNLRRGYSKQIFTDQIEKAVQLTQDSLRDWRPGMSVQLVPYFKRLITNQLGILLMNHAPGEYLSDIQMFFTNATQVNIM